MTRLIFAGTPDFAVLSLAGLVEHGYQPEMVLTQPDRPAGRGQKLQPPPVKRLALECGLRVEQPVRLDEMRAELERLRPEIIVVVAYAHKIPYWLLTLPPMGVLNVHASLLPKYRGASPVAAALLNGDSETGVSIMRLAEGWDTGPVFRQRTLPIAPEDDAGTLTDKLAHLGAELLLEVVDLRVRGMITPQRQDEAKASYAPKLTKEDGRINWTKPAWRLAREVRAYSPWPGAFTTWDGRLLKVLGARVAERTDSSLDSQNDKGDAPHDAQRARDDSRGTEEPGRVLAGLEVATSDGRLVFERLQLEGRKTVDSGEFERGQPGIVGAKLGD